MRRHRHASPETELPRRRLFDGGSSASRPLPSRPDDTFRIPKSAIVIFVSFGVFLLLMVHVYLFSVLFSESSTTLKIDDHFTVPTPPIRRPHVERDQQTFIPKRRLQPLQEQDRSQYTIRMNTWQRNEQLLVSVEWHSKCPGVAQIQIVWCDKENEPPKELLEYDKVVIERHEANTLNERFNILLPTPTLGILSIDDDVLRPCESIDSGFFRWTESPTRMVGFDGRLHVENEDGSWKVSALFGGKVHVVIEKPHQCPEILSNVLGNLAVWVHEVSKLVVFCLSLLSEFVFLIVVSLSVPRKRRTSTACR